MKTTLMLALLGLLAVAPTARAGFDTEETTMTPPPVHMLKQSPVTRGEAGDRAFALNEPNMPRVLAASPEGRNAELHAIVDFLDVERSPRYQPTPKSTWCNIYAYDVCYLAGVYLPHVFWTQEAIADLAKGADVPIRYGVTVSELSANGLYAWLDRWAPAYGWTRHTDPGEAQRRVNAGGVGVVCAEARGGIGHIAVIVAESTRQVAYRDARGRVVAPVQSQAGRTNRRLFSKAPWWAAPYYSRWGFWTIGDCAPTEKTCPTCDGSGRVRV